MIGRLTAFLDQMDFAVLQTCLTGPGGVFPDDPDYCRCFNRNPEQDSAIDATDVTIFMMCAVDSGPEIAADVCCDGGVGCP